LLIPLVYFLSNYLQIYQWYYYCIEKQKVLFS
jgi:hypothetical protein